MFFSATMSVMGAGKTARLLQLFYDYNRIGKKVLLMKPALDSRETTICSRNGLEAECEVINSVEDIHSIKDIDILLVDEVQFLSPEEVEALRELSIREDITVYAFGLKTDFKGNLFPGAKRVIELADEIETLSTLCKCGKKATMNLKYDNRTGKVIKEGDSIDCGYEDKYQAVCYSHWVVDNISEIK